MSANNHITQEFQLIVTFFNQQITASKHKLQPGLKCILFVCQMLPVSITGGILPEARKITCCLTGCADLDPGVHWEAHHPVDSLDLFPWTS